MAGQCIWNLSSLVSFVSLFIQATVSVLTRNYSRYDLQPDRRASATSTTEAGPGLPPPLALEAEDNESTMSSRHRASRTFELSRLRHLSQRERLAALREMRSRNEEQPQGGEEQEGAREATAAAAAAARDTAESEEDGRATSLAAKLRDKFRIRTRAQA